MWKWLRKKDREAFGSTVAVGFAVNREDGMTALHVGDAYTLLDRNERHMLATMLTGEAHCDHAWTSLFDTSMEGPLGRLSMVCCKCAKPKWDWIPSRALRRA